MAKKSGKTKRQRPTPSSKRAGAGKRAKAAKRATRKAAGGRTAKGKGPKKAASPARARKLKRTAKAAPARKAMPAAKRKSPASKRPGVKRTAARAPASRKAAARGGSGREETLAQTPEAGRTKRGPTNPMPTRRSTGTPAGAGTSRSPRLDRERRKLREIDETVPSPPSSLDLDSQGPSAARSGRKHLQDAKEDHTETSPVLTGGDVDADWEDAYSVGDEAPGGDNPTPDQDRVDDIGKALGVTYDDNEELKASDKIADRDKHRWELDPASSEDYPDRDKE
jgi:Family of unknown function (DUF6335)